MSTFACDKGLSFSLLVLGFFSSSSSSPFVLPLLSRSDDSGLLTHKDTLPVRSVVLGDVHRPGSESAYRVGPLRCHGDSKSGPEP